MTNPASRLLASAASGLVLLLAALLALSLPLSLLAANLGRVVFNPPLVRRLLIAEAAHSDLIPAALAQVSEQSAQYREAAGGMLFGQPGPDVTLLISFLDQDDWRRVRPELLPEPLLAAWVTAAVDGVYTWIDSAAPAPHIVWDMRAFKNQVNSGAGLRAVQVIYDNLPACSPAELEAPQPGRLCALPESWRAEQQAVFMAASAQAVTDLLPDEWTLIPEPAAPPGLAALPPWLRQIRLLAAWAWAVSAGLAVLIMLAGVRSWAALNRRLGWPLLLGGLLSLLPPLVYGQALSAALAALPPAALQDEAAQLAFRLAREVFRPMLVQALVIVFLSLLLRLWGRLRAVSEV